MMIWQDRNMSECFKVFYVKLYVHSLVDKLKWIKNVLHNLIVHQVGHLPSDFYWRFLELTFTENWKGHVVKHNYVNWRIVIPICTSAQLFLLHKVICRLHVSTHKWSSSGLFFTWDLTCKEWAWRWLFINRNL